MRGRKPRVYLYIYPFGEMTLCGHFVKDLSIVSLVQTVLEKTFLNGL